MKNKVFCQKKIISPCYNCPLLPGYISDQNPETESDQICLK